MKRFYKFLMPLVAIVAMALPVSVAAQTTCQITIVGTDDFGDGWNDGTLTLTQGTTTVGSFTLTYGSTGTQTFTVSSDVPVVFSWIEGDYDDEVSFEIYDGGNAMVYSAQYPMAGVVYTMNTPCPACGTPTGLASTVTVSDANLTWNAGEGSSWEIVWGTGNFDPDTVTVNYDYVSTNSYSFFNLADGAYTVYLRADCDTDGYSSWASTTFFVNTNGCVIIINGTDDFGDGWNGGSIAVIQGGVTLQTVTMTGGSTFTTIIPVSASPISFVWSSGLYDSEVSFTITNGNGIVFNTITYPLEGEVFSMPNPCTNCFMTSSIVVDSNTIDGVTIHWNGDGANSWMVFLNNQYVGDVADSTYTFENLSSNTLYTLGVSTLCDDGDTSAMATVTIRTHVPTLTLCPLRRTSSPTALVPALSPVAGTS